MQVSKIKRYVDPLANAGNIVIMVMVIMTAISMLILNDDYFETLSAVMLNVSVIMTMITRLVRDACVFSEDQNLINRCKSVIIDNAEDQSVAPYNQDIKKSELDIVKHTYRLAKWSNLGFFIVCEIFSITFAAVAANLLMYEVFGGLGDNASDVISMLLIMLVVMVALVIARVMYWNRLTKFEASLFRLTFGEYFDINQFKDDYVCDDDELEKIDK